MKNIRGINMEQGFQILYKNKFGILQRSHFWGNADELYQHLAILTELNEATDIVIRRIDHER